MLRRDGNGDRARRFSYFACMSSIYIYIYFKQDARDLYAKIKDKLDKEQWNAEDNEEYEDGEGNVLNRRTYEDLARQGLM